MPRPKSGDPRRDPAVFFGEEFMRVRPAAGFPTQDALAAAMHVSRDVVTKAENGKQVVTDDTFRRWMDACRVSAEVCDYLTRALVLAREADGGVVPRWAEKWRAAERLADYLQIFAPVLAPGQFQAEEYALELFLEAGMTPEQAAEHVRLRLQRQEILDGPNASRVTAVLDESGLYRVVGSPAVLLGQLNHLLELSKRPNIIIQIVRLPNHYNGLENWFEIATGRMITATLNMITVEDQTTDIPVVVDKAIVLFEQVRARAATWRSREPRSWRPSRNARASSNSRLAQVQPQREWRQRLRRGRPRPRRDPRPRHPATRPRPSPPANPESLAPLHRHPPRGVSREMVPLARTRACY
jgi:transcriptional regulator with XRE-family HTH domain